MKIASIKFRVILALVLIVTITSSLFAGGVMLIKTQLEEVIFENMVSAQLDELKQRLDANQYDESTLFTGWHFYYGSSTTALPPEIAELPAGSHHSVLVDGNYYQIEVGEWREQQVYLTYDIAEWEAQEHTVLTMLFYGLVLVLLASLIMGWSATRAILAPVRALSKRLTQIQPGERRLQIADDYQGTEIGEIAAAFDKYMERLDHFVERERSFTAAASHELRTPLSVMMGASDVLAENPQSAASMRAIARIKRACSEMLAFIEATLYLSREDATSIDQSAAIDMVSIVESLLEDSAPQLADRDIRIEKNFLGSPELVQPSSLVQITVGNILRNAIEHTRQGCITIDIDSDGIIVTDTGEGIPADKLEQVFERSYSTKNGGTGLGLNLVRRICDRFGWSIDIASEVGVGTKVGITFY